MRRLAAIMLLTLAGIPVTAPAGTEVPAAFFAGKHGEGLAETVRMHCRPLRLATAAEMTFSIRDPFTGSDITVSSGSMPGGYVSGQAVPSAWWSENHTYGDTIGRDLINYLPVGQDVTRHRRDLPPARTVGIPTFANAWWCAGTSVIYGIETEVYAPPEEWRGTLARIYFYMATVYHSRVLTPRAYMMLTSTPYPGLTEYATEMLLDWHRSFPPGPDEIEANDRAEQLQGNRNPFTDLPALAEHIWGEKADTPYGGADGEPVPLHSTYRLSSDRWIYLTSPHIPADAVWSIDGHLQTASCLSLTELGRGAHHISYRSPSTGTQGRVMITITD